jgi:hypothetical protein
MPSFSVVEMKVIHPEAIQHRAEQRLRDRLKFLIGLSRCKRLKYCAADCRGIRGSVGESKCGRKIWDSRACRSEGQ